MTHQDYTLQERIHLVENPSFLYYANGGSFIPGSIKNALATQGPPSHYRNECLCNAMVNFNMIDIVGRGIRKIFNQQWKRRFPMPDYEIDAAKKEVAVRLYGNAINEKYTKLLKENNDLSFDDCLLLDAVQKGHKLNQADAQSLLSRGLIEAQGDTLYISLDVARKTKQIPEYTKCKGLEKQKLIQMILQYLKNAGATGAKRDGIYEYLKDVLPLNKTEEQKLRSLGDLLKAMKADELIKTDGRNWYLK